MYLYDGIVLYGCNRLVTMELHTISVAGNRPRLPPTTLFDEILLLYFHY